MRLLDIQKLVEMAGPAQTCGNCGASPIHKTHNYSKDASGNTQWKCKAANIAAFKAAGGTPTGTVFVPATGSTPAVAPAAASASPFKSTIAQAVAPAQSAPAQPPAAPAPPPAPTAPKPTAPPAASAPPAAAAPAKPSSSRPLGEQLTEWLSKHELTKIATVADDNSVSFSESVVFSELRLRALPVKFTSIDGDFTIAGGKIESFKNFPDKITEAVYLSHLDISSMDGCTPSIGESLTIKSMNSLASLDTSTPIEIGGDLVIDSTSLKSLKGIHKNIKRVKGKVTITQELKESVLGLLMMRGVTEVALHSSNRQIADILNKHLKSEDKDVNEAQEEMIDAGFPAFARL